MELSGRDITGRVQPDKSIDVIDEAGARIRLKSMSKPPNMAELEEQIERLSIDKDEAVKAADYERAAELRDQCENLRKKKEQIQKDWRARAKEVDGVVDEEVVAEVVSKMTGIPLTRLEKAESERLLKLEDELHKKVVSQDEAIKAISKAIRRARSGLKDPKRPMGSFIFVGPSGVGKTLLSKSLAEFMFGDEDALIRIDMSEYMEKHNVSRLIGAPPGYVGYEEGGQLTERIRRRPYSVVLLDEIEKAHPDVFNMLLQIMEEGQLTDSFGRHVDFRNTVLIMTSNIGAELIKSKGGFGFTKPSEEADYQKMKQTLHSEIERHFRPEFINRLDDVIVFRPLNRTDLVGIVEYELKKVRGRLSERNIELDLDDKAKDFLIEKGYNPDFGARPLRRAIEQNIEDPLSEAILRGEFKSGQVVKVTHEEGGELLKLESTASTPPAKAPPEAAKASARSPRENCLKMKMKRGRRSNRRPRLFLCRVKKRVARPAERFLSRSRPCPGACDSKTRPIAHEYMLRWPCHSIHTCAKNHGLALQQQLRDLNRVEGGALAQLVATHKNRQAVFRLPVQAQILADAAHIHIVLG